MSHWIYTTIELSRGKKSLRPKLLPRLLEPYFQTGTFDLNFEAVLPPPALLDGEELIAWKHENWLSRWFTVDGEIKDGKYHFATVNGYPERLYKSLAKKIGHSFFVTTCSTEDMVWSKDEYRKDGKIRPIDYVNCQVIDYQQLNDRDKRMVKRATKLCRRWKKDISLNRSISGSGVPALA